MDRIDAAQKLHLDALEEAYRRQHGAAVALLKAEVGEGIEYVNAAARAVVSPNGAWFECLDLPMEFSGLAGEPTAHRFVADAEAIALLERLHGLTKEVKSDNTREFGLFVLYVRAGIADERGSYVFHLTNRAGDMPSRSQEIGAYRPGTLPLFYRCRLDTDLDTAGLPVRRGALFCLANPGEKHLLVELPYEGDNLVDLADAPSNPVTQ